MVTRRPLPLLALAVVALALVTGWARAGQSTATASSPTRMAGATGSPWPATADGTASPTRGDAVGDVRLPDDGTVPAAPAAPGSPSVGDDIGGRDAQPCVVRADCGGALVLGGLVLAVAIPAVAPTIGGLTPATVVVTPAPGWHPALRSGRLFRPPRAT